MFQNFKKLFIGNDVTWTNKNNKFICTIRAPTERDRIEQVTTKNLNQNTYLDEVDKENTFWLQQRGKVYRSVNWVYRYYTSFDYGVSLDNKIPYYSKQIRRRGFKQEKRKERKLVYTTYEYFKTLTTEEKKPMALVAGAKFFVPERIYNERRINFLKKATFVAKYDVS